MIVRWLVAAVIAALWCWPLTTASAASCDADVYLSVDYAQHLLNYSAESLDKACLDIVATSGRPSIDTAWQARAQDPWSAHGQVDGAHVTSTDSSWRAAFDMNLHPGQTARLLLPFVAIDFAHIDPPPTNLQALTTPSTLALDGRIANDALEYDGAPDADSTIPVVIPFTPVHKTISLTLTPLYGRMLLGQTDSFRVSGMLGIDTARSARELVRHCQSPPGYSTDNYRSADLLFTLDNPPRSGFAMQPRLYLAKPSYVAVATDVIGCEANAGSGTVQTAFNGRVQHRPDLGTGFPSGWLPATSFECNRAIGPGANTVPRPASPPPVGCPTDAGAWPRGAYELTLGEIALGPDDTLDVQIPDVDVLGVRPVPDHVNLGPTAAAAMSYKGPARFALTIEYRPRAVLLAGQAPSTIRALAQPLDAGIVGLLTVDASGCASPLALPTIPAIALAAIATWTVARTRGPIAWIAAGCLVAVLSLGVRGVFGLLAGSLLLWACRGGGNAAIRWGAAGLGLVAVGLGLQLDCQWTAPFPSLQTDAPAAPLTPLLLLPLSALLIVGFWRSLPSNPAPSLFGIAFALISVAAFDVVQKSLIVLAVLGLALIWIAIGLQRRRDQMSVAALADRFRACVRGTIVVPIGLLLLALFTFENSLTNTVAYAEAFPQWTVGLQTLVQFVSIVMTFLALGGLFLLVYPLLPSRIGYIKALAFGAYFLILFLVGVGADERLIVSLPQLTVGRAMYYLAVPVLIGIYLDLRYRPLPAPPVPPTASPSPGSGAGAYLDSLRGRISTVGAIVSILAPPIYAAVAKSPVVTSYFDLLNQLARAA